MTVHLTPNSVSGARLPYENSHGKKPDLKNMAFSPFGQPTIVKTLPSGDKDMPRAEYGIALGWKLQTPGAIKSLVVLDSCYCSLVQYVNTEFKKHSF